MLKSRNRVGRRSQTKKPAMWWRIHGHKNCSPAVRHCILHLCTSNLTRHSSLILMLRTLLCGFTIGQDSHIGSFSFEVRHTQIALFGFANLRRCIPSDYLGKPAESKECTLKSCFNIAKLLKSGSSVPGADLPVVLILLLLWRVKQGQIFTFGQCAIYHSLKIVPFGRRFH